MDDPAAGTQSVTIDSASLSEGGYVVVHDSDRNGAVVGQSEYLVPGTHRNVRIRVDGELRDGAPLVAVAYRDTDGDETLTLAEPGTDGAYPAPGRDEVVTVPVTVGG